jgi:DNA-binding MarR family transcriptional regulator
MSNAELLPFEMTPVVRDCCLCLHAQRAARALARRFDEALRPLDLTNGQFSLLMALNRPEPPTLGSVANLLAMDRTTLTAALKVLTRRKLVKVAIDKQDKRSRRLTITPTGRSLLAKAFPIWKREHAAAEKDVAGASADALRAALKALS